jgi:hypothetical protein
MKNGVSDLVVLMRKRDERPQKIIYTVGEDLHK